MLAILQNLMSSDNLVRRTTEEQFDGFVQNNPGELILGLTSCANDNALPNVIRSMAIVLLRRVLTRQPELWATRITPDTKQRIKFELLSSLDSPHSVENSVRKKLCDTISIVALMSFENEETWSELIPFMFRSVTNEQSSAVQKENALNLFTNLSEFIRLQLEKEFPRIAGILSKLASSNETSLDVRIAATTATWSLVYACSQDSENEILSPFKPIVKISLEVLSDALAANHPHASDPLEDLIDLASSVHARLFSKTDLEQTILLMLKICSSTDSRSSRLRILALELTVSLMETRGAAVRKIKPPENAVVHMILPILISMMMELPDLGQKQLRDWGNRYPANACAASASQHADDDDDCDIDASTSFSASLEYLDRITRAIKPKFVLPIVFARAGELLQQSNGNWKSQHSALLMIAHVVEFMPKKEPDLEQLCRTASVFAGEHPHMRVRHAGFTLIARLSYDCAPNVEISHSEILVSTLLRGLKDPVPRVQAHAAMALINFCTACNEHELFEACVQPYMNQMISGIFDCLQNSTTIVQENVISALSSVAKCAGENFAPYYSFAMPILKSALENISARDYALKAKLLDCVSSIGLSVGRNVFLPDAGWVVNLLEQTSLINDDPNVQHIQIAWFRLSEVLGEELGPYLHRIVPFVLAIAEKSILDDDDEDDEDNDEVDPDQNFETINALNLARTTAVDDHLLALETLCTFASHTKRAFLPYLEPTLRIFLKNSQRDNCSHDDIRSRSNEGLPDLVGCALCCLEQNLCSIETFGTIFKETLQILCVASNAEDDIDVLKVIIRSIVTILQSVEPLVMDKKQDICPDYVETCAAMLTQLLRDSIQRRALEYAELKCDHAEDELDEEAEFEYEERVQEEHQLHFLLTAAFGALIKVNPNSFIPQAFMSDSVGPHIMDLVHHVRLCHDQKIGVFILDDILEFALMNTLSKDLVKSFCNKLLETIRTEKSTSSKEPMSEVANLIQASSYGLGVCAQRFANSWEYCLQSAKELVRIIQNAPKDLRSGDFGGALDNSASALMKIARFCGTALDGSHLSQDILFEIWLKYFPLECDVQESQSNSLALLTMIEDEKIPYFFKPASLPLVIRAFACIIGTDFLEEKYIDRALSLLTSFKAQVGAEAFDKIVKSSVPIEQLQRLQTLS